jgi:hypothetical protein
MQGSRQNGVGRRVKDIKDLLSFEKCQSGTQKQESFEPSLPIYNPAIATCRYLDELHAREWSYLT